MDATQRLSQLRRDIDALQELRASRGWAVLVECADDEIRQAFQHFVATPTVADQHLHFQRGAIWAAFRMQEMPQSLLSRLMAEHEILNATARKPEEEQNNGTS